MSTEPDITELIVKQAAIADANQRASAVAYLATMTLLIDAGLVTIEQAAQRIEQIHRVSPEGYHSPLVAERIQILTVWLRAHDKPQRHGWTPEVIQGGLDHQRETDPSCDSAQCTLPPRDQPET